MKKYLLILLGILTTSQVSAEETYTDEQILSAITPMLYYKSINLTINPVSNLNNLSKSNIYSQRQHYTDNSYFFPKEHIPSPEIFSQIIDNKPWKSTTAYHCKHKSNNDDTNGNSFVSREINNPDILVGLSRDLTIVINNPTQWPTWFCDEPENHLLPSRLYHDIFHNILSVEYTLDPKILPYKLFPRYTLSDLNARDLGYKYMYILKTKNITMTSAENLIHPTRDYIHLGRNCSAAGGCNNVSPSKPDTDFIINKLPAQIIIKLWTEYPKDKTSPADRYVNILIKSK